MKAGDKVICIKIGSNGNNAPLKLHKEYIIQDVRFCQYCGKMRIDVGIVAPEKLTHVKCFCGQRHEANGQWWTSPDRFVKLDDIKLESEMHEQLQRQNMED